jgi:hypothetical protein
VTSTSHVPVSPFRTADCSDCALAPLAEARRIAHVKPKALIARVLRMVVDTFQFMLISSAALAVDMTFVTQRGYAASGTLR